MFERYTERARRVIFFARYEASMFGSPYIETEHLLLGLLREDKGLLRELIPNLNAESIRQQIEGATLIREKIHTSVDLPLSNECKRVLAYAAEEAERLNHRHIGTEHLFLGLLREEKTFAARLLTESGVRIESARAEIAGLSDAVAAGAGGITAGTGGSRFFQRHAETRVVMRRSIVLVNEADGTSLGETFSIDVPRVGDEIVVKNIRGTVTRLAYHYEQTHYVIEGREANLKPEKIEVFVRVSKSE